MKRFSLLPCTLAFLLGGCNLPTNKQPPNKVVSSSLAPAQEEKTRPFKKDTLTKLLIAEFAGHRGDFEKTLALYVEQAKKTNDPNVAKRAYEIASFLEKRSDQLDMAILWAKLEANDIEANRAALFELLRNNMTRDISPHLERVFTQTQKLDFLQLNSNVLPAEIYPQLINYIDQLLIKYPNNHQLIYTKATLFSANKEPQRALTLLNTLPTTVQQQNEVVLLKTYLLQSTGKTTEAIALLNKEIKNTSQNKQLRLNLAHRLVSDGKLEEAKQQFLLLNQQYPTDEDIRFALVLICLETQQWDEAINYLNIMLEHGINPSVIYFYLASAYDNKGDKEKALNYYQQVNDEENFLNASVNAARILFEQNKTKEAQQYLTKARKDQPILATPLYLFEVEELQNRKKLQQARQLINQAIKTDPKNTSFYYSRALLEEKSNNIAQAEKDLRHIIKLEPNNDSAINALGYILTERTTRYKEALQLIRQAYKLNPNSPATMDSMGWIYYKLGKLPEAQEYLQQAYDTYPDPDIATHLGEVLWKLNDKEQAKTIWSKALEENPQHTILLETIKRLTGSQGL